MSIRKNKIYSVNPIGIVTARPVKKICFIVFFNENTFIFYKLSPINKMSSSYQLILKERGTALQSPAPHDIESAKPALLLFSLLDFVFIVKQNALGMPLFYIILIDKSVARNNYDVALLRFPCRSSVQTDYT